MNGDSDYYRIFKENSSTMDEKTSRYTAEKSKQKISDLDSEPPNTLIELWNDLKILSEILIAYWQNRYTDISWHTVIIISVCLSYFLSPVDLIFDWIPFGGGYIDDAVIIRLGLEYVADEINKYKAHKSALLK